MKLQVFVLLAGHDEIWSDLGLIVHDMVWNCWMQLEMFQFNCEKVDWLGLFSVKRNNYWVDITSLILLNNLSWNNLLSIGESSLTLMCDFFAVFQSFDNVVVTFESYVRKVYDYICGLVEWKLVELFFLLKLDKSWRGKMM